MNPKERIAQYYDRYAGAYERQHGVALEGQTYNFKNYYEPFLIKALPRPGKVLELGCGTGVYTQWLVERGFSVMGMDISREMLKLAMQRCPEASFQEGDCEDPSICLGESVMGNGFDAIVGINAFSYLPHKERALRNYRRLLLPEGRLVLMDMNGLCPYYPVMAWMNKNEIREWLPLIRACNQHNLVPLLERAGFRVDAFEHFAFIPNGVSREAVTLLRPLDRILRFIPEIRSHAMRMGVVATPT